MNRIRLLLGENRLSLFVLTLLLHEMMVVILNSGFFHLPVFLGDSLGYHNLAIQISELLKSGSYTWGAVYDKSWYPFFVGIVYLVGGSSVMLGASMNSIFIALAAVMFFDIVLFFNKAINKKIIFWTVFIVFNFYASFLFHTGLLLKEASLVFLSVAILFCFVHVLRKRDFKLVYFLLIILLYVGLSYLRFFVGYAMMAGVVLGWLCSDMYTLHKRVILGIALTMGIFLMTLYLPIYNIVQNADNFRFSNIVQPKFIYNTRFYYYKNGASTSNINVVEKVHSSEGDNYKFSISGIGKSILNIIFGPFPWQMSILRYLIVCLDLVLWYPVLVFGFIGLVQSRARLNILIIAPLIFLILALSMGVDNAGALIRYRIPMFFLLAVFVPAGLSFLFGLKKYENSIHNN